MRHAVSISGMRTRGRAASGPHKRLPALACALQEALEAFGRLPVNQYATGWVLCCVGRAYCEMVDYRQAAHIFEWARQADPTRLEVGVCSLGASHAQGLRVQAVASA